MVHIRRVDKLGPMLGELQVEAYALAAGSAWTGRGLIWRRRRPPAQDEVIHTVTTESVASQNRAIEIAYARAHAEALRIVLRHFTCY